MSEQPNNIDTYQSLNSTEMNLETDVDFQKGSPDLIPFAIVEARRLAKEALKPSVEIPVEETRLKSIRDASAVIASVREMEAA